MTTKMINKSQNKVVSLKTSGTHRVYLNNSRKGTELFIYHNNFFKAKSKLEVFGYEECAEEEFNNYFKPKE